MNHFETGLMNMYPQVAIDKLRQAVESATDPLDIVNAFMRTSFMEIPSMHPYWERRICTLAQLIVDSRRFHGDTEDA